MAFDALLIWECEGDLEKLDERSLAGSFGSDDENASKLIRDETLTGTVPRALRCGNFHV